MSRKIRAIIQNSLNQTKRRDEVKNREIRYLPDLSIANLLSVSVLVQIILNYYPNYPTHHLYFGKVETPYSTLGKQGFESRVEVNARKEPQQLICEGKLLTLPLRLQRHYT